MNDTLCPHTTWFDILTFGVRGLAWSDEAREAPFDRYPAVLKQPLDEDLWRLCTESAGLYVDFQTASNRIHVRWTMAPARAGRHVSFMAPVAHSGMDLYGKDTNGRWWWVGACPADSSADGAAANTGNGVLNRTLLDGQLRTYRLYLPLLRRMERCEIGSSYAHATNVTSRSHPIAYYGTSIVHGVAVDRPGMTHAAQLGRLLGREVYNLGVSGRARCEPEIARALARLHVDLYIIDVLPNNSAGEIEERLPHFLHALRRIDTTTPVLLIGDRTFADAAFCPERNALKQAKDRVLLDIVDQLGSDGINRFYTALHPDWFGEDRDGTVDGSHPNSLGAYRFAHSLLPFVQAHLESGAV